MHLPYEIFSGEHAAIGKEALVIVNDEPFAQECLVQAIHSMFPHTAVMGVSTVGELHEVTGSAIALVLLRVPAEPATRSHWAVEVRSIIEQCPNAPIVILSPSTNAISVTEAITLGVRGIIPVTTSFKVATAAIQLVMAGGTYYPYPLTAGMNDAVRRADGGEADASEPFTVAQGTRRHSLTIIEKTRNMLGLDTNESGVMFTARELEVMEGLQKGWSNKWIAHSLHLSENTIKVHIQRIMRKLHATNRTEAVVRHRELQASR